MALTLEHPSQTQLYWYNDDLMTSNTIGAFRWNARGSPGFLDIVNSTLRDFGVSIYTVMDGRPKLTSQAPGFHIINHVIYHTTLDTPALVPAQGMERATRAFTTSLLYGVAVASDQRGYLVVAEWPRKEVPLGEWAVHFLQEGQLVVSLDPFGDHGHADVLGKRQDCSHDRLGFGALVDVLDKRPVDLEGIDGESV